MKFCCEVPFNSEISRTFTHKGAKLVRGRGFEPLKAYADSTVLIPLRHRIPSLQAETKRFRS